jgi:polar amino acid transport system substrate-binding protein
VHTAKKAALTALAILLADLATPASARSLAAVRQRGVLSVCAPPNALPAATKRGQPRGIQIELAQVIADRLGVALDVAWVTEMAMYRRVDCDLVLDVFTTYHALKETRLAPTIPYQHTGVALVLRPGLDSVTGFGDLPKEARLAVQFGSAAQYILGKRGLKTIAFGFEDEMMAAVASGEVDAAAVTPVSAGWYLHQHPDTKLRLVHAYEAEPELAWDLAVGMRRADRGMRRAVDDIVRQMLADGTVSRIYAAYGIEHRLPEQAARLAPDPQAAKPSAAAGTSAPP